MSALARYFVKQKKRVAGYDRTHTKLTNSLSKEKIEVSYADNFSETPDFIKNSTKNDILIIYTPAVSKENNLLTYFTENKYKDGRIKLTKWWQEFYDRIRDNFINRYDKDIVGGFKGHDIRIT